MKFANHQAERKSSAASGASSGGRAGGGTSLASVQKIHSVKAFNVKNT